MTREGQQFGNYRLTRLLDSGGFAEVYLAEHVFVAKKVAVKLLTTTLGPAEVEQFRNEARAIALLKHHNIVGMLDFGVQAGVPYLVMEYAEQGALHQRYPKGTQLSPATILPYVQQLASALQEAHKHGIIHRDIKPANILVGAQQEILLSDFGIAIILDSGNMGNLLPPAGTPTYMAPEQVNGHPVAASDQYSLAIVIYEWLAGDPPFKGLVSEVLSQHLHTPPPSLCQRVQGLSPDIELVVLKALAKAPGDRWPTIQDFAAALEQAINGNRATWPSLVPPPVSSPLPQPQKPFNRRILLVGAFAVLTTIASAAIAWRELVGPPKPTVSPTPTGKPSTPTPTPTTRARGALFYINKSHNNVVNALAWSPDGQRIASGSADHTVQLFNATNGASLFFYRGHQSGVNSVAWSHDGQRIASASSDHTVHVWNAADGRKPFIYSGHTARVNAVAWSPDGQRIASASDDGTVQVWNATDGSFPFSYQGHNDKVNAVVWSPDGLYIASGSADHTVQVWNAENRGQPYFYRGHTNAVNALSWSPNGQHIASGSASGIVQVWDALNGKDAFFYQGHTARVNVVAWSPDGLEIASGSDDHSVQVRDVNGVGPFSYRDSHAPVDAMAWSLDGMRIASGGGDHWVRVWEAR